MAITPLYSDRQQLDAIIISSTDPAGADGSGSGTGVVWLDGSVLKVRDRNNAAWVTTGGAMYPAPVNADRKSVV